MKGYSDTIAPAARRGLYARRQSLRRAHARCRRSVPLQQGPDGQGRCRSAPRSRPGTICSRAVKTLKAAGITPIVVGGADKWPMHFYWTYLAMRVGGKPAFDAALRGENGGFEGETFVKAGELFKQLVDLQPFQNGFLGIKNPQAVGYFGDGKGAMTLAISIVYRQQSVLAADKTVWARTRSAGSLSRRPRRQGRSPTDTLGGITRLAGDQGCAAGGGGLPEVLRLQGRAEAARGRQLHHPRRQGRRGRPQQPLHANRSPTSCRSPPITRTSSTRTSGRRSGASSTTSRSRSPAAA